MIQPLRVVVALACAGIALSACSREATTPAPQAIGASLTVEPLTLPVPEGSGMPQLTVSGERAIVSWIETSVAGASLKFAERTDSGWSTPRTVASGTDWFVNWADVPSVLRLENGTLAAHWLKETDPAAEAYDVVMAFSKDDGKTWSAPVSPHHDATKTEHGFVSMFALPQSKLGLVWLDGRQAVLDAANHNDNMSVRTAVFDDRGTQVSDTLVDDRVCECCPTSAAITSDGPIVAYRDRSAEEIRDIAVTRFVNGAWTPAKIVHDDRWEIRACPVNGPAISARGKTVAVAWFTAKDDDGRAFAAFSEDGGATFGAPVRLDDGGSIGRVGIALLDGGEAAASWIERLDKRAELRVRRVDATGRRSPATTVSALAGSRSSGFPRLVRRDREVIFAWTEPEGERTTIRTASARW